jgi:hypothetical protein
MLTEALVTNPAHMSVNPKARTIGHAVGAGSAKVPDNPDFSSGS